MKTMKEKNGNKMDNKPFLKDTSLCAIVRDEMINPAQLPGKPGIRSFVESHVPYVEQAVIVDTGSIDGTRQELEQLVSEFPNLKVSDRPFDNYAAARNDSLTKTETKYALVLDVDELITQENFRKLHEDILTGQKIDPKRKLSVPYFFELGIKEILADGKVESSGGHPIRLFEKNKGEFFNEGDNMNEFLYTTGLNGYRYKINSGSPNVFSSKKGILHFRPNRVISSKEMPLTFDNYNPEKLKWINWYSQPERFSEPPSLRECFKYWKQPNPHRIKYK